MKKKIGYKKARDANDNICLIVKMEILGQTNEERDNIADPLYAAYRTDKVKVIDIYHVDNPDKKYCFAFSILNNYFLYVKNTIIEPDWYDDYIDHTVGHGIHYYLSEDVAKLYLANHTKTFAGEYKGWHDNGQLSEKCYFKNGEIHGNFISYLTNGTIHSKFEFCNGINISVH